MLLNAFAPQQSSRFSGRSRVARLGVERCLELAKNCRFFRDGREARLHAHEERASRPSSRYRSELPGKWKIIFFYRRIQPSLPTEIAGVRASRREFEDPATRRARRIDRQRVREARLGAATNKDLNKLPIWSFADTKGSLVDGLGVRSPGMAWRSATTFIVDPGKRHPARLCDST